MTEAPGVTGVTGVMGAARAVAGLFRDGLAVSPADAETLCQTAGAPDAALALAELQADADSCEAAPLLAQVYSPGPDAMRALEPALQAAGLDEAGVRELGRGAAALVLRNGACALLPGGIRVPLFPRQDDVLGYVRRLRPEATPPPGLLAVLARRFPVGVAEDLAADLAAGLAVILRHSRLEWTPARLFFMTTLLDRLVPHDDAPALAAWAAGFLDLAGGEFDLRAAMVERRAALVARLRQAEWQEQAQGRGSFEVRMSQGLRLGHVHGPEVRAELALLDRVCRLVLGLPGEHLDAAGGVAERDLGGAETPDELLGLLLQAPLE